MICRLARPTDQHIAVVPSRSPRPSTIAAANVASVPQRSPLRYPGGKTWLVPHIRSWLSERCDVLVEPFAGGATVSLTAVMEDRVDRAWMVELDRDVAAFWRAALRHSAELIQLVQAFEMSRESVLDLECRAPASVVEHGFRTLVMNRARRGGVLAPGASFIHSGEKGNGLASRWYPETLSTRLENISEFSERLNFYEGDGIGVLEVVAAHRRTRVFIDPPYTVPSGKRAGARLYAHHLVNHQRIFEVLAAAGIDFLMTYDWSDEILELVGKYDFRAVTVAMKNSHHDRIPELIISRDRLFE